MPGLSRLTIYGLASTIVFVYTVLHAFRQRSNFYSAAVYLSKSNACTMILWNQGIYQTVLFGKFLQAIFFGELRMIEVERLQERGWFAVTETLLALTIFKDEFDSSFVLLFISLLFLKIFHWLSADRIELMEQSANIPTTFHLRIVALLSWLWILDALFLTFAVESILIDGPTVMIMFASEYMILLAMVWSTTLKYLLNVVDLRSEVPWEDKSIYVFYVDLATDFFKLVTYLSFFGLILTFYGLPLNILRDVYLTFRSFVLKCRDLRRYRQATRNMDTLYPNATADEMDRMVDKMCIICREDMEYRGPPVPGPAAEGPEPPPPAPIPAPSRAGPNETPKKLPCGHVFHFHCLRSWLERQQSCPTCRRPVLATEQDRARAAPAPAAPVAPAAPGPVPAADEAIRQAQLNLARNLGREAFAVVFPGMPFPPDVAIAANAGPQARPAAAVNGAPNGEDGPAPAMPGQDPTASLGSTPTPTASLLAPGPPQAGTTITPATRVGQTHDNPLARFSLPDHPLPPTGEAGLYSVPTYPIPNAPGYAGIAYGAYPAQAHGRPGQQTTAQATRIPNLEERLAQIRARMSAASLGVTTSPSTPLVPPTTPNPTSFADSPVQSTTGQPSTPALNPSPILVESSSTSVETKSADISPQATRREAALAAAERRAAASKANGTPKPLSSKPLSPLPSPLANVTNALGSPPELVVFPPEALVGSQPTPVSPASISIPLSNGSSIPPTASSSSPPVATNHASPSPRAIPRLIPLFDPANAIGSSAYPGLFSGLPSTHFMPGSFDGTARPLSMQPLIPESPTEQQLRELSQLTRRGIEERLRVLVGFQRRIAALAQDMGQVLSVLPPEDLPSAPHNEPAELAGTSDKGKGKASSVDAETLEELYNAAKGLDEMDS